MSHDFIASSLIFLVATVIAVPIAKRYKLGAVLGYLAAGVIIGPYGLKLIREPETVLAFSEIGVVFLLFILGLELSPARLRAMRRVVFGLGPAQVIVTAVVASLVTAVFVPGVSTAAIIGFAVCISSTAFAVQLLAERQELNTEHGRATFGVLLFQDLAAVPVVALIPLLALGDATSISGSVMLASIGKVLAAIALVFAIGRFLLRPFLRFVAEGASVEVFAAASLLVVLGTGFLMESVGLSLGLGAFLAGVLLADSEYAHEVESHIDPYRGLLLGLFFIAVGMTLDLGLVKSQPGLVVGITFGLLAGKLLVMAALCWLFGYRGAVLLRIALLLACGGEFAFVVIETALQASLLPLGIAGLVKVAVALSMPITALAYLGLSHVIGKKPVSVTPEETIPNLDAQVVIAGYGRVGQIVSRILQAQKIAYVAIDKEAQNVDFVRSRFDRIVYYGNATRPEILRAARVEHAKVFVLAIDDPDASIRTARLVRRLYPKVQIIARARNRQHAFRLMDLGVTEVFRETLDTSLHMTHRVLENLGLSADMAADRVERFRSHDQALMLEQALMYDDEAALFQSARDALTDLDRLFEADAKVASESTRH